MIKKEYVTYALVFLAALSVMFIGESDATQDLTGYVVYTQQQIDARVNARNVAQDTTTSRSSGSTTLNMNAGLGVSDNSVDTLTQQEQVQITATEITADATEAPVISGRAYVFKGVSPTDAMYDSPSWGADVGFMPTYSLSLHISTNYAIKKVSIQTPEQPGSVYSDLTSDAPSYMKSCIDKYECKLDHTLFTGLTQAKKFDLVDDYSTETNGFYGDFCPAVKSCSTTHLVYVIIELADGSSKSITLNAANDFYFESPDWFTKTSSPLSWAGLNNYYKGTVSSAAEYGEHNYEWPGLCDCEDEYVSVGALGQLANTGSLAYFGDQGEEDEEEVYAAETVPSVAAEPTKTSTTANARTATQEVCFEVPNDGLFRLVYNEARDKYYLELDANQ